MLIVICRACGADNTQVPIKKGMCQSCRTHYNW